MGVVSKIFEKFKKPKQYTFICCPKCNNELVSNGHEIEDNDGIIKYKCSKCGNITFWDFTHFPVPYLITCANCEYLKMNNDGSAFCDEKDCSPDTLVKHTVYGSTLRKEKLMEQKPQICDEVCVNVSMPNKDHLTTEQVKKKPILDENRN